MSNDIAVFLDLDNLVIGARQADLTFDINLVLEHIKVTTNGRIVLRRSYGDWRQSQQQLKELTTAGFTTQSNARINDFSKNLADMQIVVDTMDTLVDGHQYSIYVLITGDRDFTPLAQSLRKRGKHVIGVGVKHSTSQTFASLCDEYIYYEDLVPKPELTSARIEEILTKALDDLLAKEDQVRASILMERMQELSRGVFDKTHYTGSFRKFLSRYPTLLTVNQDGSTLYIHRPRPERQASLRPLHLRYRTRLKNQRLRVVVANERIAIIKDTIKYLQQDQEWRWRQLIDHIYEQYQASERGISKNAINATMLIVRQAKILQIIKGRSLATSRVVLALKGNRIMQEALVRCDAVFLRGILNSQEPFEIEEVALALYDSKEQTRYLQIVMSKLDQLN